MVRLIANGDSQSHIPQVSRFIFGRNALEDMNIDLGWASPTHRQH